MCVWRVRVVNTIHIHIITYQEGGGRCQVEAVVHDAVEHGAHGVLADAEVPVCVLVIL